MPLANTSFLMLWLSALVLVCVSTPLPNPNALDVAAPRVAVGAAMPLCFLLGMAIVLLVLQQRQRAEHSLGFERPFHRVPLQMGNVRSRFVRDCDCGEDTKDWISPGFSDGNWCFGGERENACDISHFPLVAEAVLGIVN